MPRMLSPLLSFPHSLGKGVDPFPYKKRKEQTQNKTRKAQYCICDFCLLLNKQKCVYLYEISLHPLWLESHLNLKEVLRGL